MTMWAPLCHFNQESITYFWKICIFWHFYVILTLFVHIFYSWRLCALTSKMCVYRDNFSRYTKIWDNFRNKSVYHLKWCPRLKRAPLYVVDNLAQSVTPFAEIVVCTMNLWVISTNNRWLIFQKLCIFWHFYVILTLFEHIMGLKYL